ncbi:VCBS repeat-containing protein [Streptomyces sp. CC208A]|uniref:FG-GAP repeat domain-containing protein n=1 Tax=Streptomyces sp. CC208A TaxID=3044573 RepID=UPI0024A9DA46|nr:VCBS repeat-containing protein [Streptomyces sp. CC208A]
MTHHRSTAARRLGAVIAVVLMATAGPAVLPAGAAPTGSVPVAAIAGTADATAPLLKPGDTIWGLGRTGFLSWDAEDPNIQRWTRLSDGAVTTFPREATAFGSRDSDVVAVRGYDTVTLRDMAAGKELLSVPLRPNRYVGAVGSTVFTVASESGEGPLELHSPGANGPVRRTATGLPLGAAGQHVVAAAGGEALVRYTTGSGETLVRHLAVLDIASATVTSTHRTGTPGDYTDFALSAGYLAWTEAEGTATTVVVLDRSTRKVQRFKVAEARRLFIGLVGKWVTYSRPGGLQEYSADPANALTARSLTSTATRKLLDHTVSDIDAPGDAHGFLGGTAAGGEGLYRIAPGTDGVPVATRLAATGAPTQVTLLRHTVPATVDLDRTGGKLSMAWYLSRNNVDMTVTVRNTRTGESVTENVTQSTRDEDPQPMRFDWNGTLSWQGKPDFWTAASAGPYTWQITATPRNGIGPALKKSGTFTVTRKAGAHDYDSDGSPDILARDTTGVLWIQDVHHHPDWRETRQNPESRVGGGWQVYDRIEATGNLGGTASPDLVARDRDGVLWLYRGTGDGKAPFATRTRIGGGWNTYVHLAGGSDLTGDGRPDLVATDKSGRLWMYRGTGSASAPFATRRLIGSGGWGVYNQLTATGNIGGAAPGDLVARDKDGVLWLYLGKGDGTFAPRTRIGGGWGGYKELIGSGDVNKDGRPDLYVTFQEYGSPAAGLYRGTGAWRTPFRPLERVYNVQFGRTFNLFA